MGTQLASMMMDQKKKESNFISLGDGEKTVGLIKDIKKIIKQGYGGDETEVLRMILEVAYEDIGTVLKNFDNGTMKWLEQIIENDIDVGDRIEITRHGAPKSTKTYYTAQVIERRKE